MEQQEFKEKLLLEIKKTEALIEEYRILSGPVNPDVAIGRISRMDAINNKSITESAKRQAELKLNQLKRVLVSIGQPDFGLCLKCRKSIPIGRILIRPESLHCVNCAR